MSVVHDKIAPTFVSAVLDHAPVAGAYARIQEIEAAGAQLQRMVALLDANSAQGFSLSEEALQGIARDFCAYDFATHKAPLPQFFGRRLLDQIQELRQEGIARLSEATGWSVESLQERMRREGKTPVPSVFSGTENLLEGIKHTFGFQEGVEGRNIGAGLLAWGGMIAGCDALRRAVLGVPVTVIAEDGDILTERQRQPGTAIAEGALAGASLWGALKLAEQNMLRLK